MKTNKPKKSTFSIIWGLVLDILLVIALIVIGTSFLMSFGDFLWNCVLFVLGTLCYIIGGCIIYFGVFRVRDGVCRFMDE